MAKKTTLDEVGSMLTHVVKHMATKEDVAELKTELKPDIAGIKSELRDIKARLKEIESAIEDQAGHSKEIDHALERITAIEKHLGIKHPAREHQNSATTSNSTN
jgi:predicted RNase H-like nuclease (RuvC/YqgF family)